MYQTKLAAVAKELSKTGDVLHSNKIWKHDHTVFHWWTHRATWVFFLGPGNWVINWRNASFSLPNTLTTASISATPQIYGWVTQFLGIFSGIQKAIQTIIFVTLEQFKSNTLSPSHACFGDFFFYFHFLDATYKARHSVTCSTNLTILRWCKMRPRNLCDSFTNLKVRGKLFIAV